MTILSSRSKTAGRLALAVALIATTTVALSGCGGSNNGNTGSQAHIRSLNLCSNGGAATIYINNGSTNGTQSFEQSSSYLYLDGGNSTFAFTLSNAPNTAYPTLTKGLNSGSYYSVILFGNVNVANQATRGFPFLSVQQDDKTTPATGNARVRIVQAAPDSSAVDVKVGSQSVATDFMYGVIGVGIAPASGNPATSYTDVPAGSETIQANAAGTATPLQFYTPVTATLQSGHLYTISLVETTVPVAATSTTAAVNAAYTANLTDDGT